jgi:hypothetical protein
MNLHVSDIKPRLYSLKTFLTERGAEVLEPTSNFELLRFRTVKGVSVIYFKKTGDITFFGEAEDVWKAYTRNLSWRAMPSSKSKRSSVDIQTIRKRDGDLCFYCQEHVDKKEESAEHLVALTHGGPDHISNKFLSHRECNLHAGYMSAVEKIKIHVNSVLRVSFEKVRKETCK